MSDKFTLYKEEEFKAEPIRTKFRFERLQGNTYYHNIAIINEKFKSYCHITLLDKKPPQGVKLYYHEINSNENKLIWKFAPRVNRYKFVENK